MCKAHNASHGSTAGPKALQHGNCLLDCPLCPLKMIYNYGSLQNNGRSEKRSQRATQCLGPFHKKVFFVGCFRASMLVLWTVGWQHPEIKHVYPSEATSRGLCCFQVTVRHLPLASRQ